MTGTSNIKADSSVFIARADPDEVAIRRTDWNMIRDWVKVLPRPWRISLPIGFFLLGMAVTAGAESHSEPAGTEGRHVYAAIAISALVAGVVVLIADWKLKHELKGGAKQLERFIDHIDKALPPEEKK